jgi:hypothetical protein
LETAKTEILLSGLSHVTGAATVAELDKEAVLMGEVQRLAAGVDRAINAMRAYAAANPIHYPMEGAQDPNGVHQWLREFD